MPNSEESATPGGTEGRRQPRSSIFLAAVMRAGPETAPVKVRNLSSNGALLETPVSPPVGTTIDLLRGALAARGEVMWQSGTKCGVRFSSEVSVSDWLKTPPASPQGRVDELVALFKAGGIPEANSSAVSPRPRHARSREKLIDDLEAAISLMQVLENDLTSSNETLARHAVTLQNLDIAVQMMRAIAAELSRDSNCAPQDKFKPDHS